MVGRCRYYDALFVVKKIPGRWLRDDPEGSVTNKEVYMEDEHG